MLARALRLFQIPRLPPPPTEIDISVSQARPGGSKFRIDFNRPFEHLSRELHVLTRPFMKVLTSPKIQFVRFDIRRGWLQEAEFLAFSKRQASRFQNASGDFVLDCEDIFNLSIKAFRPELVPVARVNELDADADALSSFSDTAVKKRLNAKTLPDLARIQADSAKCEAGCSGRNVETADLTEGVEDFFCNTITEVFLVAFRAEICERQDSDRADFFFSSLGPLRLFSRFGNRGRSRTFLQSDDVQID